MLVTAAPGEISVTAKVSAYYRKFSDIAFAAEVATLIAWGSWPPSRIERRILRPSSPALEPLVQRAGHDKRTWSRRHRPSFG